MPQVHLRIGDGRGLSYTLYRLYYMYCLRHFRPTHLLKKVPPSSVSLCDLTFSVTRRIGKQRTNCGPMALSIAPPVPGFLLACRNRRCGSKVQEPASPTGCHGSLLRNVLDSGTNGSPSCFRAPHRSRTAICGLPSCFSRLPQVIRTWWCATARHLTGTGCSFQMC